jgi:hypothetical protein
MPVKLKQLILKESLSAEDVSKTFTNAYIVLFDIDKEYIEIDTKSLLPPSFSYFYYALKVNIVYRNRKYKIHHQFFYYKFPENELKGLSYDEWMNMLSVSEKFKDIEVFPHSLKEKNPLYKFTTSIYDDDGNHIGYESKNFHSITDIITKTKEIIDKFDGDNENDEYVDAPIPTKSRDMALREGFYGSKNFWISPQGKMIEVNDHATWAVTNVLTIADLTTVKNKNDEYIDDSMALKLTKDPNLAYMELSGSTDIYEAMIRKKWLRASYSRADTELVVDLANKQNAMDYRRFINKAQMDSLINYGIMHEMIVELDHTYKKLYEPPKFDVAEIVLRENVDRESLERFRIPLSNYLSNQFKEYDENQLLMFGLTTDELKDAFLDKILNIDIYFEFGEKTNPVGQYNSRDNIITIDDVDRTWYRKSENYRKYTDSVIFHELIHAINYHKKLWNSVTYDGLIFDDRYYGDLEEIRAYKSQIRDFLVAHLELSRKQAESMMNKYSTDFSEYRKKWMSRYYDLKENKKSGRYSGYLGIVNHDGSIDTKYFEGDLIDHSEIKHTNHGRFRYYITHLYPQYDKYIIWTDNPNEDEKTVVENWLHKKGLPFKKHYYYRNLMNDGIEPEWKKKPAIYTSTYSSEGKTKTLTAINYRKIVSELNKLHEDKIRTAWKKLKDDVTGYVSWDRISKETKLSVEDIAKTVKFIFESDPNRKVVSFTVNRAGDMTYFRFNDMNLKEGIRLNTINTELDKLEKEWDRLDSMGGQESKQIEITNQIQKLQKEKEHWKKIYGAINKDTKDEIIRLKNARDFFIKKLDLLNVKNLIHISYSASIPEKDNGNLKYTKSDKGEYIRFTIKISNRKDLDIDKKVKALAHELVHVKQLISGKFDPQNKTWNGEKIIASNYWKQPWESDARIQAENLWIEFNKSLIKETITNVPHTLYHATYNALTPSIYKHGIIPKGITHRNYPEAEYGVYLGSNKHFAASFAESTDDENIPEGWSSEIVILTIDTNKLNKTLIEKDPQYHLVLTPDDKKDDFPRLYIYKGIIPPSAITDIEDYN